MKNSKLDLQKFKVAKLNNMNAIRGGSQNTSVDGGTSETTIGPLESSLPCLISNDQ